MNSYSISKNHFYYLGFTDGLKGQVDFPEPKSTKTGQSSKRRPGSASQIDQDLNKKSRFRTEIEWGPWIPDRVSLSTDNFFQSESLWSQFAFLVHETLMAIWLFMQYLERIYEVWNGPWKGFYQTWSLVSHSNNVQWLFYPWEFFWNDWVGLVSLIPGSKIYSISVSRHPYIQSGHKIIIWPWLGLPNVSSWHHFI